MVNWPDRLVEHYQARTLARFLFILTQRMGVYTVGHHHLSQVQFSLCDTAARLHKRFESASSWFVSGDCPLTVQLLYAY